MNDDKQVARRLVDGDDKEIGWIIFCPACRCGHSFKTGMWTFNGNVEKPTFSPSMLVKSGHHVDGKHPCWCDYHKRADADPGAPTCEICHSFVTDGMIRFLGDCTHKLAGQTVPLEPF